MIVTCNICKNNTQCKDKKLIIFRIITIFKHYSSCIHPLFLIFVRMLALLLLVAGLSCSRCLFLCSSALWFAFAGRLAGFLSQDFAVSRSVFIRTQAQFRKSVSHLLQSLIHRTLLQLQHHLLLLQGWGASETQTERVRNTFYNVNSFGPFAKIAGAVLGSPWGESDWLLPEAVCQTWALSSPVGCVCVLPRAVQRRAAGKLHQVCLFLFPHTAPEAQRRYFHRRTLFRINKT